MPSCIAVMKKPERVAPLSPLGALETVKPAASLSFQASLIQRERVASRKAFICAETPPM